MAISARELIFYIRAENQASGVIKRVAKDLGSLKNQKDVQKAANNANVAAQTKVANLTQNIARNSESIQRAQVAASRSARMAADAQKTAIFNNTAATRQLAAEAQTLHEADLARLNTLEKQTGILAEQEEVARQSAAATAAHWNAVSKAIPLERLQRFANVARTVGRVAQIGGVLALAGVGASASSAANFNSQITLAATQDRPVGASSATTAKRASDLTKVVLAQMKQFPASAQDMSDALYEIFSGTKIQNISKASDLLKTFNMMAVAGGTDLKTMTDAGITLFNNFPNEFKKPTDAANAFFAAVRYARTTPAQFANSLTSVLPVAKAAGETFKDVADAMALVTRESGGKATPRDATGLARLMEMFSNQKVQDGLKGLGISVEDSTGKMRPLLDIMTDIYDKMVLTGKLKPGPDTLNFFKTISGATGTIQGRRIFDYLLTNMKEYHLVSKQVNSDNTEFTKSFEAMSKTPGVTWKVFTNQLHALVIEIGTYAIPALIQLGQPIEKLIKWFDTLSPHTQKEIAYFLTFGSVAAVLTGTLLSLGGSLGSIVLAFKAMQIMKEARGAGAVAGLAEDAGAATPLVSLLLIALVGLSVLLIKYPGTVQKVIGVFGGLKTVLIALAGVMAVLTFARLTGGFQGLFTSASVAEGEVSALRLSLLRLSLIGVITIPIVISLSEKFDKDPRNKGKLGTALNDTIGKIPILGSVAKAGAEAGRKAADATGLSDKARAEAQANAARKAATEFSSQFSKTRELQLIQTSKSASNFVKGQAQSAYNSQDWQLLNKLYGQVMAPAVAKMKAVNADIKKTNLADSVANQTIIFQKNLANVAKLKAAYEKAPNLSTYTAYQNALTALQKSSTATQFGYAQDYLDKTVAANKKALSQQTKDNSAYLDQLQNAYSNIESTYNTFLQQNQSNFGQLFSGPFMQSPLEQAKLSYNNNKASGSDLVKDLKSQVSQFNTFNRQIDLLTKKGAPKSLTDQLLALGPSALPDIKALNKLSPAAMKQYELTWNRGQVAIKRQTMRQLDGQLAIYEKFGKNVAKAIITGIQSQDPALEATLEGIVNKMFPNLVKAAGKAPKTVPKGSKTTLAPTTHVTHHHYEPKITVDKSEGVIGALQRSYFQFRTTKR